MHIADQAKVLPEHNFIICKILCKVNLTLPKKSERPDFD